MLENPFTPDIKHIAVAAPAGPPDKSRINDSCKLLNSFGIKVSVMPNVFARADEDYLSASIEKRVCDIHKCWQDETIDLLISARGGYGSAQLLPFLDWKLLKSRPLPVLGYSDITALHLAMFRKKAGIPIASPMTDKFVDVLDDPYTVKHIRRALSTGLKKELLLMPEGFKLKVIKKGSALAPVIPLNLTVLVSLFGSPYLPDFKGKILLLEDINEEVRKLDRSLTQLRLAGVFNKCAGIIFGGFRKCGSHKDREILFRTMAEYINGPVLCGFPFGHFLPMTAIRFGTKISITESGSIYY